MSTIHPDILFGGDGTKGSPFVVSPVRYWFSTIAQRETIQSIFGASAYNPHGLRRYYESPNGTPQNKDLCEHVLLIDGKEVSVWFDLSNVTKFETDPALVKAREGLRESMANDPVAQRVQDEMRKAMGLAPNQKSKGCLVLFLVVIIGVASALLVFR